MAIPLSACFDYRASMHALGRTWAGRSTDDGQVSLVGPGPSVTLGDGRVTFTRDEPSPSLVRQAGLDVGAAPGALVQEGDLLSCRRVLTGQVGLSLTRDRRLLLALGVSAHRTEPYVTVDDDPRVEEIALARRIRYIDRPATAIVWLDPAHPADLEERLRELDRPYAGHRAVVARTDDASVRLALNRRAMHRDHYQPGSRSFDTAPERFASLEAWLQYGRALPTERPSDLWLRVRIGQAEQRVPQGTTTTIDGWLVHAHCVNEPGIPGRWSELAVARADAGVDTAMLEQSAAAVARGLWIERGAL
jgi:hypothetical protein